MEINKISFKSDLMNQMQKIQKNPQPAAATNVAEKIDAVELSTKKQKESKNKPETKAIIAAVSGAIVLVLAFIKRKAIGNFFKKIFKESDTAGVKGKGIKPKIELPKPKFSCGPENAEQYAKEKADYIKSIWQDYIYIETPFVPMNKEKNLLGLKALQKYGTNKDLKNLPREYRILEDNDLMLEYAKLVNKVGKDFNDFHTLETTISRHKDIFSLDTMEEVMKGVKKHTVDDSPKGHWTNTDFSTYQDFEYFANKAKDQGKTQMEENAKAVMHRIVEDNSWMKDEIAKKVNNLLNN